MTGQQFKYVGYFPTVQLSKILEFDVVKAEPDRVWRVMGRRVQTTEKQVTRPLPFIAVQKEGRVQTFFAYEWTRHGRLDAGAVRETLGANGVQEVHVEELVVGIPRHVFREEWLRRLKVKGSPEGGPMLAAVFRIASALKTKDDSKYIDNIRGSMGADWLRQGGKYSSLDLSRLMEARLWLKGYGEEYELTDEAAMAAVYEVDTGCASERTYRLTHGDVWELVGLRQVVHGR